MRMEGGRFRRFSRSNHNQTVLPLRVRHLSNTVSCWYCDFKSSALNDPLFHFGRRYSRYLRVWFSVGTGFSLATLFGVTLVLLWELARFLNLFGSDYETISLLSDFLFGYSPSVLSLADTGYICISTVISVAAHELGHALSATRSKLELFIFSFSLLFALFCSTSLGFIVYSYFVHLTIIHTNSNKELGHKIRIMRLLVPLKNYIYNYFMHLDTNIICKVDGSHDLVS